jgi:hypothetical protein
MAAADSEFARLLAVAHTDPRVVGLVLGGSRGKDASYVTERSDYDAYVIVSDASALDDYAERFPTRHGDPVEAIFVALDTFRRHALPGSGTEWNAYTFAHVTPLLDKLDGEIGEIVVEKSRRDPESAAVPLDGYINMYYRAAKNQRDGLTREAHFDAAESVAWFLEFLFPACGRVRPYNKWLQWELANHPLPDPWSAGETERRLEAILCTGDVAEQQSLFRDVHTFARELGFADVIDSWEPDVDWLRGQAIS